MSSLLVLHASAMAPFTGPPNYALCRSCHPPALHDSQVLDWFSERKMSVYSISCGSALLYNNIFPKHKERLNKRMSELVSGCAMAYMASNLHESVLSCTSSANYRTAYEGESMRKYAILLNVLALSYESINHH